MPERRFPVIWPEARDARCFLRDAGCPKTVPWAFVAEHYRQCLHNHGQTPEHLAKRGGLSVNEMLCVVSDLRWSERLAFSDYAAVPMLLAALKQWEKDHA